MNIKQQNITGLLGFDCKVSFETVVVSEPIMNVEAIAFRASDDVDQTKMISFSYVDVR